MAAEIEYTNEEGLGLTLENVGAIVLRYGLVIILLWVGLLKFTAYEAEGIQGTGRQFAADVVDARHYECAGGFDADRHSRNYSRHNDRAALVRTADFGNRQRRRDYYVFDYAELYANHAGRLAAGLRFPVSVADAGTISGKGFAASRRGNLDGGRGVSRRADNRGTNINPLKFPVKRAKSV